MFKKIRLQNYRTHIDTSIELKDITLIIGSNNSGKSNLLSGISYFSTLISRAFPGSQKEKSLSHSNYFSHKHSLSDDNTPIIFSCDWEDSGDSISYELEIYADEDEEVGCRESLTINYEKRKETFIHGHKTSSNEILLRTKIKNANDIEDDKKVFIDKFFRALAFLYYYNFQPAFLKGQAFAVEYVDGQPTPAAKRNFAKETGLNRKRPNIASEIGREGANFQELIRYVKEHEEETYGKFLGYLRRFEDSFNGIIVKGSQAKWQFDMGKSNTFPYFDADKISDGIVKAGAVALLCAMKRPPSIIMLEEVENGINQKNLAEFLSWLSSASEHGKRTQFIITSHSPSVIREFSEKTDCVYNVHLKKKKGYVSDVTNLNEAIKPLVRFGSIKEEAVFEVDDVIHIRPYELTELFYNGVLGEL